MNRNVVLSLLACVNLALLTAIILYVVEPKKAYAQETGLHQNYMVVSAEVESGLDGLFVLDTRKRVLYVMYTERRGAAEVLIRPSDSRNLDDDFRNVE